MVINGKFFYIGVFEMEEEIKLLAKWTAALWEVYKKYFGLAMKQEHFDALVDELRAVWVESGENDLIEEMAEVFANDLDRRAKHHASNEA